MRCGSHATILAYGATVGPALEAAELLASQEIEVRVINARFAKPIDPRMLSTVLSPGHAVLTVDDHTVCAQHLNAVSVVRKVVVFDSVTTRRGPNPGSNVAVASVAGDKGITGNANATTSVESSHAAGDLAIFAFDAATAGASH